MKFLIPLLFGLLSVFLPAAEPLKITLPTDNRALLEGDLENFYMWVPRIFENETSRPWTAGQYGFVRTLTRTTSEGVIATKFHEGLDIKPTKRDRNSNPLDEVRAIADGEVVYINNARGGSTYGIYVVVKHEWGYGPFYSLYAHLASVSVEVGQKISGGSPLAIMGYTGSGLNRERAHLHLELCMLSSNNFVEWLGTKTNHGIYDGRNLIGIDIASLYIATKEGAEITIPDFLKGASPYFKVAIPRKHSLEIVKRYPWLKRGDHEAPSASWELSFTDSGIPLAVAPSHREVTQATVTYVRTTRSKHEYYTRKRLTGTGRQASLTRSGRKFIQLFSYE
ncbi:MAG: M23 family metallopeptidase [Akkermansiaceae bacterium]